ncbi:MAG: hypothetical protein OP8BY_0681 [Candidatus Saccharicenans subterraneus]|uniref:Uncharacterized protein n=1 Tax=Candidatus Saccharicenans subterraneus TaxID=2508984 RepID=A0A3E2BJX8_9BACT|nr:MAG: hypothetical protein OP8BY_0681 [Candidatus Saccharicenans subterraneum]
MPGFWRKKFFLFHVSTFFRFRASAQFTAEPGRFILLQKTDRLNREIKKSPMAGTVPQFFSAGRRKKSQPVRVTIILF